MNIIQQLQRNIPQPVSPRDVDFTALAGKRARFGEAAIEARRVEVYAWCSENGANYFHIAMSFAPYLWEDMYNRKTDATAQMDALIALDVWARYRSGVVCATYVEGVRS